MRWPLFVSGAAFGAEVFLRPLFLLETRCSRNVGSAGVEEVAREVASILN